MIPENNLNKQTIVVGLSGGVDSAVAALLLKESGADVRAVFMRNWDDADEQAACHDKEDLIAAVAAADTLQLPFEVVSFVEEYRRLVFAPFLRELQRGRTPNPDVLCNAAIKFDAFHQYAQNIGASAVATGHYARIEYLSGQLRLCKGEDAAKDQSYFLHRLSEEQLARSLFPLAQMHKAEVREKARAAGLNNWARKDSTGICFIGERPFAEFLARFLPETSGDIVDEEGNVVGRHRGLPFYTIGQRRGLRVGGGGPWFVAEKDGANNILRVVRGAANAALYRRVVHLEDAHWIAAKPPPANWVYAARLRHGQVPASCTLTEVDENRAVIAFAEPQWAATPGQYAVVYDGNVCLGGGVIID